ncbi:MAG: diacylglycerol kinase [Sulfuriferula sp.]
MQGILHAWQQEVSFRVQTLFGIIALGSLLVLHPPMIWAALVIIMVCMVLVMELFNTAMEQVLDGVHPEKVEFVRIAKDCAAGAVLVSSVAALVIYLMMLVELMSNS